MMTGKKIASLDIGLSSVMLLLAFYDKSGLFKVIDEYSGISRLGFEIAKTNTLADDKISLTLDLCSEMVEMAIKDGAEKIIATATSSIKNTINKTQFLIACRSRFNIFPNILTEHEEAKLIYKGATSEYPNAEQPIIVIEVGGDSTYIAFGRKEAMIKSHIMNIGSFYSYDNPDKYSGILSFLNPPRPGSYITAELTAFRNEIDSWLDGRKPVIICSGSLASLFYSALIGKTVISRTSIEGKVCSLKNLQKIYLTVRRINLENILKLPGIDPERAQTLPAALSILYETLKILNASEFTLTANGLRTGILKTYLEKTSLWD